MFLRRILPITALVAGLTTPLMLAGAETPLAGVPVEADSVASEQRYIVKFTKGTDPQTGAKAVRGRGGRVEKVLTHVFSGAVASMSPQAAAALSRNPHVAIVEPDYEATAFDTQTPAPWGLDRSDQRTLPLNGSYQAEADGSGVTAYVIDTGVRTDHADFGGRVRSGFSAVSDGRGTNDCNGHGTHVAGTIGGARHGLAKQVALVPIRVLDCTGSGDYSGVIAGLDWLIGQHPDGAPAVANMSLGGPASSSLDSAVTAVVADGVTLVVAAGNEAVDACTTSPARAPAALTVGATDETDSRASFSNFGSCLDLFAPGVRIVSDWYTSSTATVSSSGTSMAAPHVAGAAATLLESRPSLSPSQVAYQLLTTATTSAVSEAGAGSPNRLLWADPTLAAAAPPAQPPEPPSTEEPLLPTTPTEATSPIAPQPSEPDEVSAPSAPTSVTARAMGDRSVSVSWSPSRSNGSPVTGYVVTVDPVDPTRTAAVNSVSVGSQSTSAKVAGLQPAAFYAFSVKATSAVGASRASAFTDPVAPVKLLPQTSIERGPSDGGFALSRKATFGYSSGSAVAFRCTLDGARRDCGSTSVVLRSLKPGTHMFTAAAVDSDGDADASPAARTWTVPRNNTALGHSAGWAKKKRPGSYLGSYSMTTRRGAAVSTDISKARELALVASKGPGHGKVSIYLGSRLVEEVTLSARTLKKRRVIPVATFDRPATGTVRIVVTSRHKPVQIEGLGVAIR